MFGRNTAPEMGKREIHNKDLRTAGEAGAGRGVDCVGGGVVQGGWEGEGDDGGRAAAEGGRDGYGAVVGGFGALGGEGGWYGLPGCVLHQRSAMVVGSGILGW